MDKRKLFALFWLVAMIFPYSRLLPYWDDLRRAFWRLFASELAHVIGHLFLFSIFTALVLAVFQLPLDWRSAVLVAGVVLLVGVGQELLQLQVKGRAFGGPEVFDLGVDLVGGALGWQLARWMRHYGRYLRMAYYMLKSA